MPMKWWDFVAGILAANGATVYLMLLLGRVTAPLPAAPMPDAELRSTWLAVCNELVHEGVEHEVKWNDVFGCLAKRSDHWERVSVQADYYMPRRPAGVAKD